MTAAAGTLLLVLSCVGHTELWVIATNRLHSRAIHRHRLRRLRSVHDVAIVLYPPVIVWLAGFRGDGLLDGASFSSLSWSVRGLLATTWIFAGFWLLSVVRWQLRRDPRRLGEHTASRFDFLRDADTEKERKDIRGEVTAVSRLSFNEIYQLEANEKRLQIYPQHQVRNTVRLAHFSDMHLVRTPGTGYYQQVVNKLQQLQPDAYVFTGDLLDVQEQLPFAADLFRQLLSVAPGYFILGNHDEHLDHELIRKEIAATGWENLAERHVVTDIRGTPVLFAGTEAPWLGANPIVPSRGTEQLRILLSHAPDQRNYAAAQDFDLMLCGHNHGGQIVLPVIGPVYTPSRFGVTYAGGLFEYRGTLMHVSRGTGSMDPIRWNCLPEITLLHIEV